LTANIPSAGIWQINYYANIGFGAASAYDEGRVFLVDSSGNTINGSQSVGWITDAANMGAAYSNQITITTTAPTTISLRGLRSAGNNMTALGISPFNGGTKVSWTKIGGFTPSTGSIGSYVNTTRTGTSQTLVGNGTDIIFNTIASTTNTIPYNTTTGVYTLQAGVTYELSANIACDTFSVADGFASINWVDATTNTQLPGITANIIQPTNRNTTETTNPTTGGIYTPSTNQTIKLRCVNASGTFSVRALSYGIIEQIGTTNISQFVGAITNTWSSGNTYPSGTLVVNNSALYQANSTIPAGTPFVVGTTGNTYSLIGAPGTSGSVTNSRSATLSATLLGNLSVGQDMTTVTNSVGNLPLSNSGVWTLTAGITYQLECSLTYDAGGTNQFQGDNFVEFVDATTNVRLPNQNGAATITSIFNARGLSRPGYTIFQYTPTTNQTIKLRVTYQNNTGSLVAQTFINQLGIAGSSGSSGSSGTSGSSGQGVNITEGSWTVTPGTANYNFSVLPDNSYSMWVRGNIPNGILAWQAEVTLTNSNVPVLGVQYAWNYTDGGSPIRLLAMPSQIFGTAGTIVNTTPGLTQNPSTTFVFQIQNQTASNQIVRWGYIRKSTQ
jgi:hypothetical protein